MVVAAVKLLVIALQYSNAESAVDHSPEEDSFAVTFNNAANFDMDVWFVVDKSPPSFLMTVAARSRAAVNSFANHKMLWVRRLPPSCAPPTATTDGVNGTVLMTVYMFHGMQESYFLDKPDRDHLLGYEGYENSRLNEEPEEQDDTCPAPSLAASLLTKPNTNCKNRHSDEYCNANQARGECVGNPGWMTVFCAKACGACHLLDPRVRCNRKNLNVNSVKAYGIGAPFGDDFDPQRPLHSMFATLPARIAKRHPQVVVTTLSTDPHIIRMDNVITDLEIKHLLETQENFGRSTDQGDFDDDGVQTRVTSESRTSLNSWCNAKCQNNRYVGRILSRIEEIVAVPRMNFESFQVLKYEKNQEYKEHHDNGDEGEKSTACGPRLLTFFMYLSDVEEGGETAFPKLGLKVKPQKGSAILWPSVRDGPKLTKSDPRTSHAALPVINGTKIAANAWIHLYDFHTANLWGCTGSFDDFTEGED